MNRRCLVSGLGTILFCMGAGLACADEPVTNARRPVSDADLRYWLGNMVWYHRFTDDELREATGLSQDELNAARERFGIHRESAPPLPEDRVFVLPYPGGRHPRIGFLEGAIRPQRETKVSVFTPWHAPGASRADYVVLDVPEAIWSNLGLTYLAHTHVPTLWTQQGIELEKLEWNRREDHSLDIRRRLPNGIELTARVVPKADHVRMTLTLTNGTDETLTDLRVQNCVMLKGADGFAQQTNDNKVFHPPYVACHDDSGTRWIITSWKPAHRTWGNVRCPCLHADPKFPDCPPGETREVQGWLSFFEGPEVDAELQRIDATRWWDAVSTDR